VLVLILEFKFFSGSALFKKVSTLFFNLFSFNVASVSSNVNNSFSKFFFYSKISGLTAINCLIVSKLFFKFFRTSNHSLVYFFVLYSNKFSFKQATFNFEFEILMDKTKIGSKYALFFKNFFVSSGFFKSFNLNLIEIDKSFLSRVSANNPVRYPTSSVSLFDNLRDSSVLIYFIQKKRIFNKGRYSRNRQTYRTGVY
jgi:hypothetical protein